MVKAEVQQYSRVAAQTGWKLCPHSDDLRVTIGIGVDGTMEANTLGNICG